MARTFIPRMTGFTDTQLNNELLKIKKSFSFLTEDDVKVLERWIEQFAEHEGAIIDEEATNVCWPTYDMNASMFLRDNPSGEVWKFESEK